MLPLGTINDERMDIKKAIKGITLDAETIKDAYLKSVFSQLLSIIEAQAGKNKQLKEDNQTLRDELNRLNGEQDKPKIRKQTRSNQDFSSENERKESNGNSKGKKKKSKKRGAIKVDRVETCTVDKDQLPSDAVFKGRKCVVVQDIVIHTDNIEFKKEVYCSPSLKKTFVAPLPDGYHGEFGPTLKALALTLHHDSQMAESSLRDFFETHGITLSASTVSRILTDNNATFHQEKKAIVEAGLASSRYQQMDDTSARVKGKNQLCCLC